MTVIEADTEVVVIIEMGPGPCDGVLGNLEDTIGIPKDYAMGTQA